MFFRVGVAVFDPGDGRSVRVGVIIRVPKKEEVKVKVEVHRGPETTHHGFRISETELGVPVPFSGIFLVAGRIGGRGSSFVL